MYVGLIPDSLCLFIIQPGNIFLETAFKNDCGILGTAGIHLVISGALFTLLPSSSFPLPSRRDDARRRNNHVVKAGSQTKDGKWNNSICRPLNDKRAAREKYMFEVLSDLEAASRQTRSSRFALAPLYLLCGCFQVHGLGL